MSKNLPTPLCVFAALLTTLCGSTVIAQLTTVVRRATSAADLDPRRLAEVDMLIKQAIEQGQLVGASALVAQGGRVAYFRTWGQRDREQNLPVERDTIFRIYSMTKPITSVAAMQLVEQGKIDLDDPISRHLPEMADLKVFQAGAGSTDDGENQIQTVDARREITLRDLLSHTSGLTYGFFGDTPVDQMYRRAGIMIMNRNLEEMVRKLGQMPLLYQPGARFQYSVSTDVVARMVEVVSGQRFDQYLQQNVFEPLDMVDTSFVVPPEKKQRFAQLYQPTDSGQLEPAPPGNSVRFTSQRNQFFSGGGGLCATIDDYLRFARMLNGGGQLDDHRVLKSETLQLMYTDQMERTEQAGGPLKFGLGFAISERGDYAWGGAAGTRFWVNPDKELVVLFMTQVLPYEPRDFGEQIRDIVYQSIKD